MRVLKNTVITTMLPRLTADMSVQYALIRSDLLSHMRDSIPEAARLPMFKVQARSTLPTHTIQLYKMKNPGVFSSGVLLGMS